VLKLNTPASGWTAYAFLPGSTLREGDDSHALITALKEIMAPALSPGSACKGSEPSSSLALTAVRFQGKGLAQLGLHILLCSDSDTAASIREAMLYAPLPYRRSSSGIGNLRHHCICKAFAICMLDLLPKVDTQGRELVLSGLTNIKLGAQFRTRSACLHEEPTQLPVSG
jgi:hypothetical protein